MKRKTRKVVVYAILAFVCLLWLLPTLSIVMASIRPFSEIRTGWWNFKNITITFKNFIRAWNHPTAPLSTGVLNSLIVASVAVLIQIAVSSPAAYAFSRAKFRGKNILFTFLVILMGIPPVMIAGPLFKTYKAIGLLNTRIGLSLVHVAVGLPWTLLFFRTFFEALPEEVLESARVVGASAFQRFRKIVLPMSLPAIASVAVLSFVGIWRNFFFALTLIFDTSKMVSVQMIPLMRGKYYVNWGLLSAASLITMAVPVLIYVALHKFYVKGMKGYTR